MLGQHRRFLELGLGGRGSSQARPHREGEKEGEGGERRSSDVETHVGSSVRSGCVASRGTVRGSAKGGGQFRRTPAAGQAQPVHLAAALAPAGVQAGGRSADRAQDGRIPARAVGRPAVDDLPALDDVEAGRLGRDVVDVRLGHQDRPALARDGGDARGHLRDDGGREPLERLVEQEQPGVEGEGAGDREHLALAARQVGPAARRVRAQAGEHLVGEGDPLGGGAALRPGPGRDLDVLGDGEVAEDPALLRARIPRRAGRWRGSGAPRWDRPRARSAPRPGGGSPSRCGAWWSCPRRSGPRDTRGRPAPPRARRRGGCGSTG